MSVAFALLVWYAVFVFSTTLHEYAHAAVADRLGDDFARAQGLATLDPTPHVQRSPFGMVIFPVVTFLFSVLQGGGGWMIGWASVPVNPTWARRHTGRFGWVSAAGPLANLALAVVSFGSLKLLLALGWARFNPVPTALHELVIPAAEAPSILGPLTALLVVGLVLNLVLGIFNLIPILPLDGAGVLEGLAPKQVRPFYDFLREQGGMGMILGILLASRLARWLIDPVLGQALVLLR